MTMDIIQEDDLAAYRDALAWLQGHYEACGTTGGRMLIAHMMGMARERINKLTQAV